MRMVSENTVKPDFDWQQLSGPDRCLVLAYQPQLFDRIDLKKLNDPDSELWGGDGDAYADFWTALLGRQPRFAKDFDGWDAFDDSHWDGLLEVQPGLEKFRM